MKIYFINGIRNGERIELDGERFTVGREADNDIVIETEGMSRYHAEFIYKSGDWHIKDLGSTNGSKVNGRLTEGEQLLKEGDVIAFGDQEIRVGPSPKPKKTEAESKKASPVIPIIQAVKEEPKEAKKSEPETSAPEKTAAKPVRKVVFQPLPQKTPEPDLKKGAPAPVIETVKPKTELKAEPKPKPEKKKEAEKSPLITARELSESAADIFTTKGKKAETKKKRETSSPAAGKHLFNILFYMSLLLAVVVFVVWFLKYSQHSQPVKTTTVTRVKKTPLLLYYVKTRVTKDNIFRFSLLIENNKAKFTIDDLKANRHHNETIKEIKPEFMRTLKSAIEDTGFMELQPVSRGAVVNNLDETREMTIALDNKTNTITIQNNSAPTSFEDIEDAIMDFADGYDLLTFAMSPKELQKRAEESFAKAEEYYANRNARAANLLAAERRYKITIDYLQQFSPKPRIWDIAKKRHAEVAEMRKKRFKALYYEVERLERLAKIKDAVEVLNEMLQLAPVDSKAYKKIQIKINRLSERLRERKK